MVLGRGLRPAPSGLSCSTSSDSLDDTDVSERSERSLVTLLTDGLSSTVASSQRIQ